MRIVPFCALAVTLIALTASAQQAAPASAGRPAAHRSPKQKVQENHASLKQISLSPVDPAALIQSIPSGAKTSSTTVKITPPGSAEDTGVMEFHAEAHAPLHTAPDLTLKSSKQPLLKDIHGEAYGGLAPGASGSQGAGGAVGASSKSGKTHIFVETDHDRNSSPH